MGTNFYIEERSVQGNQTVSEFSHIGKRSAGWTFAFQGEETRTVQGWKDRTAGMARNMKIVDEYGNDFTAEEFWQQVEQTTQPWGPNKIQPRTNRPNNGDWNDAGFNFHNGEFC